jgi:predicted cupin superfamily sugar epimerase
MDAEQLIRLLRLEPLPVEGGHFRQTWSSDVMLPASALPVRYSAPRAAGTAIYYLLTSDPDSFSAMHRLTSAEVYHFYLGDPVEMLLLHAEEDPKRVVLGADLAGGQHVQYVVPRSVWQGSRVIRGGSYALLGTTMAPGFEPSDFTLGIREELIRQFPEQAELIRELTRE